MLQQPRIQSEGSVIDSRPRQERRTHVRTHSRHQPYLRPIAGYIENSLDVRVITVREEYRYRFYLRCGTEFSETETRPQPDGNLEGRSNIGR